MEVSRLAALVCATFITTACLGKKTLTTSRSGAELADVVAPVISDLAAPGISGGLTREIQASFLFNVSDDRRLASVSCQLDDQAAIPCASGRADFSNISEGRHVLSIVARDAAGNTSEPFAFSWLADFTAPAITINSSPPTVSNQTDATLNFSALDTGSGAGAFNCRLDGVVITPCTSPLMRRGLGAGAHTLSVGAIDLAGNPSPLTTVSWTIDLTTPAATITSAPRPFTQSTSAEVRFTVPIDVVTTECQLDALGFTACTSPRTYDLLSPGNHRISVRVADQAGNSSTQVVTFVVDPSAPTLTMISAPSNPTTGTNANFQFSASDPASGIQSGSLTCQLDSGSIEICGGTRVYSGLTSGQHTFTARAQDQAGNVGTLTHTWTISSPPPPAPTVLAQVLFTPAQLQSMSTSVRAAFDNDPATSHVLSSGVVTSLPVDLGSQRPIENVILTLEMTAPADARLELYGGTTPGSLTLISSVQKTFANLEYVAFNFPQRQLRYLEVRASNFTRVGVITFEAHERVTLPLTSSLRHFGFWGIDFDYNYLSNETAAFSNVTWIRDAEAAQLPRARTNGYRVMLDTIYVFYDTANSFAIRTDFRTRWEQYKPIIMPYRDIILGFSMLDEVFSHVLIRDLTGAQKATLIAEHMTHLEQNLIPMIRADFPEKILYQNYSPLEIDPAATINAPGFPYPSLAIPTNYQFRFPAGLDWVSFDCYENWYSCAGHSIPYYFNLFKTLKKPTQKLVLLPQSVVMGRGASSLDEIQLREVLNMHFRLALDNPDVAMIAPFMYGTFPALQFTGPQTLPVVLDASRAIGAWIRARP